MLGRNDWEHSRPGCSSARPRAEPERTGSPQTVQPQGAFRAGREGAARCARGGRDPHFNCMIPAWWFHCLCRIQKGRKSGFGHAHGVGSGTTMDCHLGLRGQVPAFPAPQPGRGRWKALESSGLRTVQPKRRPATAVHRGGSKGPCPKSDLRPSKNFLKIKVDADRHPVSYRLTWSRNWRGVTEPWRHRTVASPNK